MFGIRASDAWMTNSTFSGIAEQPLGDDLRDVDVEADELAVGILEMPRRVGAAGADDQVSPRQHVLQLAGLCARRSKGEDARGRQSDDEGLHIHFALQFRSVIIVRYNGHAPPIADNHSEPALGQFKMAIANCRGWLCRLVGSRAVCSG